MTPAPISTDRKLKVMLISMVPPRNDNGVRIVMHRHFVDRQPFDLHVASTADFADDLLIHTPLQLPGSLQRLRKSRFGPRLSKWLHDFENLIWSRKVDPALSASIRSFQPEVIVTLAETGLCHMAARAAKAHQIPLAGLFLDWFPMMPPHRGHSWFRRILDRNYRRLYRECDLAICTSDGMMKVLGSHPNAHVIYPMPGTHRMPEQIRPPRTGKFRLVYVGAAQSFYGRMLRGLLGLLRNRDDLELIIVGPTNDWPEEELQRARADGTCLGFMPPEQAAEVLASADALLVVMSFEPDQELFMRTSFTTKFLDYVAFQKPILLWGPEYCTPFQVAKRENAAWIIDRPDPLAVVEALEQLSTSPIERERLQAASVRLSETLFHPDRLQQILVEEIHKLVGKNPGIASEVPVIAETAP